MFLVFWFSLVLFLVVILFNIKCLFHSQFTINTIVYGYGIISSICYQFANYLLLCALAHEFVFIRYLIYIYIYLLVGTTKNINWLFYK